MSFKSFEFSPGPLGIKFEWQDGLRINEVNEKSSNGDLQQGDRLGKQETQVNMV